MSKLHMGLLAAGLCFGLSAAVAQNVDSERDKTRAQQQTMEQKDTGAAGQTEKFKEGKPQQSEADRGEKGRGDAAEKHYDQGKPGQTEATQEQNTQTQPKQR